MEWKEPNKLAQFQDKEEHFQVLLQLLELQLFLHNKFQQVHQSSKVQSPHFGVEIKNAEGTTIKTLTYETKSQAVSKETSETMKMLLDQGFQNFQFYK